jgi:hypothetical protein
VTPGLLLLFSFDAACFLTMSTIGLAAEGLLRRYCR